jgi:aromatic ring hydroxylase
MIKTGDQHLDQLRDGRVVYIGDEKVDDVVDKVMDRYDVPDER